MNRSIPIALVAIVATFTIGCQPKLTVAKSYAIPDEGEIAKILEMPPQASEQTIKLDVKLKSGDAIDLFVVKADAVGKIIGTSVNEKKKWETGSLGFKRDMKDGSLIVKIPANTKYKVIVMQCDTAKVKSEFDLKVTN